jgi:hypothetical protein
MAVEAFVPNACLFDFGAGHKRRYIELLAICCKTREVRDAQAWQPIHFGLWLSLVERLVRDQEAVGSNPTSPINNFQRDLLPSTNNFVSNRR